VVTAALLLAALVADSPAAEPPRGLLLGEIAAGGETLRYAAYVPPDYDAARRWPLVLSLHGRGECGTDGLRQLTQGLSQAILAAPHEWPVIALFPQKPDPDREWEEYEPAVMALLETARARWPIDPDRIYLTGLSQGGHGAWILGARHTELWAAVVPVCGYVEARVRGASGAVPAGVLDGTPAALAKTLVQVPVWAFHGAADSIVPAAHSEAMIAALLAAGGDAKLTLFPGVDHGSWDPAYRDSGLAAWLLAQRRPLRTPKETPR
jgi:predicted peptidase